MDASPGLRAIPAQALEAWQDHLQGLLAKGAKPEVATADRGQQPQMVAQQRHVALNSVLTLR